VLHRVPFDSRVSHRRFNGLSEAFNTEPPFHHIGDFLWARATKELGKVGRRSMEACISVTRACLTVMSVGNGLARILFVIHHTKGVIFAIATKMGHAIDWDVDISTRIIIV